MSIQVGFLRAEDQTILTLDTKVVTHSGKNICEIVNYL